MNSSLQRSLMMNALANAEYKLSSRWRTQVRLTTASIAANFSYRYFIRGVPLFLCGMKLVSNKSAKSYLLLHAKTASHTEVCIFLFCHYSISFVHLNLGNEFIKY